MQRAVLLAPFNAQVYELTEAGGAIQPAIRGLIRWGGPFLFPMRKGETFEPDWVLLALEAIARRTAVPQCQIGLRIPYPSGMAGFIIEGGPERTRLPKAKVRASPQSKRCSMFSTDIGTTSATRRGRHQWSGQDRGELTNAAQVAKPV